jgi:hypothetical protein
MEKSYAILLLARHDMMLQAYPTPRNNMNRTFRALQTLFIKRQIWLLLVAEPAVHLTVQSR